MNLCLIILFITVFRFISYCTYRFFLLKLRTRSTMPENLISEDDPKVQFELGSQDKMKLKKCAKIDLKQFVIIVNLIV